MTEVNITKLFLAHLTAHIIVHFTQYGVVNRQLRGNWQDSKMFKVLPIIREGSLINESKIYAISAFRAEI
jgi:hypothetical protein